jgi:hypothetical protein
MIVLHKYEGGVCDRCGKADDGVRPQACSGAVDREAILKKEVELLRSEVEVWRKVAKDIIDAFDPLHPGADHTLLKYVCMGVKQSNASLRETKEKARRAAQILIAEVGADGPTDVDRAAERAVDRIQRLTAERDEARAHTSTAAFMRIERQRDEALAQVARREREHEALLETAQKALAHVEAERDALQEELDDTRDASAYKFRGTYLEDASGGRWWSQSHMSYARAEIEMLRGVGCREAKEGEPESGPCGVCLKCAEKRGAEWALAQAHREVCFAVDQERAGINVRRLTGWEICRDARGKR